MNLELLVREAVRMQDPGDAFTARVMAAVSAGKVVDIRRRRRTRIILIGAMLALGAAAAMQVLRLADSSSAQAEQVIPQPVVTESLDVDEEVAATVLPPPREVGAASKPVEQPAAVPPAEESGRITVLIMPVADQYGAPGARTAAEAFQAQLSHELSGMNDFEVLDSRQVSEADVAKADFRLTVTSLQARRPSPAQVEVISTTGATFSSGISPRYEQTGDVELPGLGTQYWPVEAKIEEAKSVNSRGAAARHFTIVPFVAISGVRQPDTPCSMGGPLMGTNDGSMDLMRRLGNACGNRTAIAAGLADVMRRPKVDSPVSQQQLVMQLRDSALSESQRRQALSRLASSNTRDMPPLDEASVKAIVDYLSGLAPAQRKIQWMVLGGRKEPGFVQPLLEVLGRDPDEEASLQALNALIRNHRNDQRVAAGIEVVAREDRREIVRMAARRVVSGDAEWNAYVLSMLRNSGRPYRERLQPVVVTFETDITATQSAVLPAILNDQEVTALTIKLLRENKSEAAKPGLTRRAISLLALSDRPEVLDLLIELALDEVLQQSAGIPQIEALQGLLRQRDDPRVRKAFDQILAGRGDSILRMQVEAALKRPPSPQ